MAERLGSRVSLAVAGEGQLRQPRPRDDIGAWQQPLDHRPDRGGAENQRFLAAAPVQDAVGEDVSALEIGGELDFVDRHESRIEIARHRLDGRDPEARIGGLDLLFAGDQRDRVRADPVGDLVVDLAREQAQRQPDHAGGMREHPLDREMGLAGIGRAEHGGDASAAVASVASNAGRKGNGHQDSENRGLMRRRAAPIRRGTGASASKCVSLSPGMSHNATLSMIFGAAG